MDYNRGIFTPELRAKLRAQHDAIAKELHREPEQPNDRAFPDEPIWSARNQRANYERIRCEGDAARLIK